MAEHDLTSRMGRYLDRHLVFPLLEFLQEKALYSDKEILQGKIELLQKTNMVDFAMDIHKSLYNTEEVPQVLKVGAAAGEAGKTRVKGGTRHHQKNKRKNSHRALRWRSGKGRRRCRRGRQGRGAGSCCAALMAGLGGRLGGRLGCGLTEEGVRAGCARRSAAGRWWRRSSRCRCRPRVWCSS